jgi:tripartite-type tricarboxylate transporter receptor subunit TctC
MPTRMLAYARAAIIVAALPSFAAVSSAQQAFPDRTVRIIVPTSPGGSIDATARLVASQLSAKWGKPVIIDNRADAAMRIGVDAVAKSAPDGYTLLVAHDGAMAMNPALYPDLTYNPEKDFAPIALVGLIPEAIMVNAAVPVTSLAEMIAIARKEPGKLNHATGGPASLLALELFKSMAAVDITSVQYRGAAPSVAGVMAGEVQVCITDIASAAPALQSDRVRALAVTTLDRSKRYPSLPTADEAGVRGYAVQVWIGMFAPAGTPKDVLRTIETDVRAALAAPDVQGKLEAVGMDVRGGSSDEMRHVLAADILKWDKLVKEKNLRIAQ